MISDESSRLHRAVRTGDEVEVSWCLKNGYDVNAKHNKLTPILCANYSKPNIIKTLLDAGAKIDMTNRSFQHPIHLAVKAANIESVRLLLDAGSNFNTRDFKYLPIHYAVSNNSMDIVQLLVEKGADLNNDCLALAAENNNDEMVDYLINQGAMKISNNLDNCDVLKAIVKMDNTRFIQRMIDQGSIDTMKRNARYFSKNPLFIAVMHGKVEYIKIMLDYGVDPYVKCKNKNILHYVADFNVDDEKVKILLDKGLNVNQRSCTGKTPLMSAVRKGSLHLIRLLIDYGADVTLIKKKGYCTSVIDYLIMKNSLHQDIIEYLSPQIYWRKKKMRKTDMSAIFASKKLRIPYENCVKELNILKKAKFYEDITLYDILVSNIYVLSGYTKNSKLEQSFLSVDKTQYPKYGEWLTKKFAAAIDRQNWLDIVANFLSKIPGLEEPSSVLAVMRFLDDYEVQKIGKLLNGE